MNSNVSHPSTTSGASTSASIRVDELEQEMGSCTGYDPGPDPTHYPDPIPGPDDDDIDEE